MGRVDAIEMVVYRFFLSYIVVLRKDRTVEAVEVLSSDYRHLFLRFAGEKRFWTCGVARACNERAHFIEFR